MSTEFAGKSVLITGAAQGVGLAAAKKFAEAGASVALLDYQERVVDVSRDIAEQFGAETLGIVADLKSNEDVQRAVDETTARFGGIDVVANIAGVFPYALFEDQTEEEVRQVMEVNFFGVMRLCKAALPALRKRKGSSIINIVSGAAFRPMINYTAYCASKGAVLAASRSLALELAPDIRVNLVSPGATASEGVKAIMAKRGKEVSEQYMKEIPMKAFAEPEHVADAIVFLASERAAHITGATIPVNGGSLMR